MRKTLAVLLACSVPLLGGWDWLTSPDRDVERGSRLFEEGKYQEALEAFREAEGGGGDPARLQYDLGTAYYKIAESLPEGEAKRDELFEKAELAFRRGAESQDPVLKSSAYYNAGNALFRRGKYQAAVDVYRRALRANPENDQARYNLELALRRVEREAEQQPGAQEEGGEQAQEDREGEQGEGGSAGDQGGEQRPESGESQDPGSRGDPEQPEGDRSEAEGRSDDGEGRSDSPGREPEEPEQGGADRRERSPEAPPARPEWGEGPEAEGTPRSEAERKLDALERRSRELRKRRLRSGSRRSRGHDRLEPKKDW